MDYRWHSLANQADDLFSIENALDRTASVYRKALWDNIDAYVEVWLEKDALSGVVSRVTGGYDVGLHVARGFASLTFLAESAEDIREIGKPTFIYHLGDHDPSGREAGRKIEASLREMAPLAEIHFERLAVTAEQIVFHNLPLRPTKHTDTRAKKFTEEHGEGSVELDAIHPDVLRLIVQQAIERHLPADQFEILKYARTKRTAGARHVCGGGAAVMRYRSLTRTGGNSEAI